MSEGVRFLLKPLRAALPSLFFVVAAVVVAAAFLRAPPPLRSDDEVRIDPVQGEQLGRWMSLPDGAGTGYRFEGGEIRETFGVFRYDGPGGRKVVELHHRDTVASPARRTERFALATASPDVPDALLDSLARSLREHEAGYAWIEADGPPAPGDAFLRRLPPLQLPIAWFLLAQAPLWLALAYLGAARTLRELPRPARFALLGAFVAAALARLVLAPLRLVMLYIGYQLTAQAIALQPIPRYGAGVPALHHLLLRAFGPDHAVILHAHALLGLATIPLVAALAHRIHRRPRVTVAAAWLVALVPAFVAHDGSEAITVPVLWFTFGGLMLVAEAFAASSPLALTGGAALLALAMIGRPELPLLAPVAALAVLVALPDARRRWALPHAAVLGVAMVVLVAPHLAHVRASARLLAAAGSLPLGHYLTPFVRVSVLDPRLYPIALAALALLAILPFGRHDEGPRWWRSLALLAVAATDFAVSQVDLDPANVLRVQVPGAIFFALVAAAGVDRAMSLPALTARFSPTARIQRLSPLAVATAVAAAVALTSIPCFSAAFGRTNEDEEESFVRAARAALPPGDAVLVRLGYGDLEGSRGGGPVHLYFPDYLFAGPAGERRVRDIVEWERDPTGPRAYFYLGVRCYTPEHSFDTRPGWQPPPTVPMRPACRRILEEHGGATLVERMAPNHGDPLRTGYYGGDTTAHMRLALVELRGR